MTKLRSDLTFTPKESRQIFTKTRHLWFLSSFSICLCIWFMLSRATLKLRIVSSFHIPINKKSYRLHRNPNRSGNTEIRNELADNLYRPGYQLQKCKNANYHLHSVVWNSHCRNCTYIILDCWYLLYFIFWVPIRIYFSQVLQNLWLLHDIYVYVAYSTQRHLAL